MQRVQNLLLSESAQKLLLSHSWPGNVRELENSIQRALILKQGDLLKAQDFALEHVASPSSQQPSPGQSASLQDQLRDSQTQMLLDTLRACGGVRKDTAAQLGISERTLRYKLKALRDRGLLT